MTTLFYPSLLVMEKNSTPVCSVSSVREHIYINGSQLLFMVLGYIFGHCSVTSC